MRLVRIGGSYNPPWCLLFTTLAKIQRDQARVVLVAPLREMQPWHPLLQLLSGFPLLIQDDIQVVISLGIHYAISSTVSCLATIQHCCRVGGLSEGASSLLDLHGETRLNLPMSTLKMVG